MAVTLEARGEARVVVVHRPEARNALDDTTMAELTRIAREIGSDRGARGIVITGQGAIFVAGGDLKELANVTTPAGAKALVRRGRAMLRAFANTGIPWIAAINGDAYGGGCEFAAAADYRIMARTAKLHWVQARFGVTPAWNTTGRLVARVGSSTTMRWLLGAAVVDANEAAERGFADELVDASHVVDRAVEFVRGVAAFDRETAKRQLGLIRAAHTDGAVAFAAREEKAFVATWCAPAHQTAVQTFLSRPRRPET